MRVTEHKKVEIKDVVIMIDKSRLAHLMNNEILRKLDIIEMRLRKLEKNSAFVD